MKKLLLATVIMFGCVSFAAAQAADVVPGSAKTTTNAKKAEALKLETATNATARGARTTTANKVTTTTKVQNGRTQTVANKSTVQPAKVVVANKVAETEEKKN